MANGNVPGWETLGANDPTRYQATFRYNRAQGAGQVKQSVKVITNRSNGNYDVYETNFGAGDRLIYSYNTSNNKTTIANKGVYEQIFTGSRSQQLSNLNQGVRKATLQLAENNASGRSGTASYNELQTLKNSPGYKSLSNVQPSRQPPLPGPANPAPANNPNSSGGGSDPLPNSANQNLADPNAFTSMVSNMEGITPQTDYGSGMLRYPLKSNGQVYDYLKVTVLKYSRKGLLQRGEGTPFGNVLLPMHPNISDANGVSWNEDRMNILQAQFGTAAYNAISRAGSIGNGKSVGQFLAAMGSDMVSTVGNIAATPGLDKLIAGYFAGQAVSSNVLGRATGAVINNNLELLFDGPKLRTFRYNFRFTPRDAKEAQTVKDIIRLFKREMAPDQTPGYLFLTTPNVFKLEYIYGREPSKPHPYLNLIKTCALTDFSVNYTPDGSYMTYEGEPSMTSYTVDMQFSELEPIYKADQETDDGMGY